MFRTFRKKNAGFTLLEMLLSVSVIAILTSIGTPVYQSFQVRNDLDVSTATLVQNLRRAQILASASSFDINWGVHVEVGAITLFKGTSFLTRDNTYDEIFELSPSITPSGLTDIVYQKFTGKPNITGDIILSSNINEIRTITINEKGTISF
ncbi:MAG: prepilin-type N-terminal cleavage/methylation domain-containing protein [Patescibacteria group bacterium]